MNSLKKIFKKIIIEIWKKKNIKKDADIQYFFCPSGIGDTLYVLAYMKEYKNIYPNKKIYFIIKESHKFLVNMYSEYIDNVLIPSKFYFKILEQYLKVNGKNSKIIYAHPFKIIYDPCKILGIKNICLLDLYKVLLEIPIDSKYCKPHISYVQKAKIKIENGINDKSILLCPYCVSIPMIDKQVWEFIADYYIKKGYKVFTNVKDENEKSIKGTYPINLKLDDFCAVVEEFKHIYAIRSGLCDLMAFFDVKLTVLYPIDKEMNYSSSYNQYNFKNIGIRKDINEVIVDMSNNKILEKIIIDD